MECPINYNKLIEDKKECISDCSKDNLYKYEFKNKCYTECPFNSIIREKDEDLSQFFLDKNIFCKPICNESNPFEIIYLQECVEYCEIKQLKNKSCILNFHHLNSEENKTKKIYDNYLINIESELTSGTYEISDLENWDDDIIHLDKATITLTTVKNQKDNKNDIYSSNVDLKDCEDILKQTYHIPDNEVLFMKKIDFIEDGMKIPKINYEVYTKFNRSNLLKLNLSYCKETKIDILIPYQLTENIDILNSSSKYYNDLCSSATSNTGTDITLKDRKEEFINNNKTVCQENCVFAEYNNEYQKVKCSCDVIKSFSTFDNMKINITELYKNFIDIKNIMNINILVCYKKLFCKKGLLYNYGSYILIGVILLHWIFIIIYYSKNSNKKIEIELNKITFGIKNMHLLIPKEKKMNGIKIFKREKILF